MASGGPDPFDINQSHATMCLCYTEELNLAAAQWIKCAPARELRHFALTFIFTLFYHR